MGGRVVMITLLLATASASASSGPPPPALSTASVDCQGKNFVVTGSSTAGSLGACVARCLADGGASGLVLVGSRPAPTFDLDSWKADFPDCCIHYVSADLSDAGSCTGLMETANEAFGGQLHGLANIAGMAFPRGTLDDTSVELWGKMMDLNLRAPFLLTQAASRIMRRSAIQGSIVNLGSIAAYGGAPFLCPYSVTKGGLSTLTKVSALELQPDRIRVNCLNIGWTLTENEDKCQAEEQGEDWLEKAEASQRIGRLLRPADIAPTIAHLLSDASTMITGSVLDISPEFIHGCLPMGTGRSSDSD